MSRILLVDRDGHDRSASQRALERDGHAVTTASCRDEALAALERDAPELVVLEVGAPCGEGLDLMGEMLARRHEVPIVLNSAYSSYRDDFRSWCAADDVPKSPDARGLRRSVRDVLDSIKASAARGNTFTFSLAENSLPELARPLVDSASAR